MSAGDDFFKAREEGFELGGGACERGLSRNETGMTRGLGAIARVLRARPSRCHRRAGRSNDISQGRCTDSVVYRTFIGREIAVQHDFRKRGEFRSHFGLEASHQEGADTRSQARGYFAVAVRDRPAHNGHGNRCGRLIALGSGSGNWLHNSSSRFSTGVPVSAKRARASSRCAARAI